MSEITAEALRINMAQCTGTMQYHKLTLGPLKATDGIAMVAKEAGAFWLVDAIASYQAKKGDEVEEQLEARWF